MSDSFFWVWLLSTVGVFAGIVGSFELLRWVVRRWMPPCLRCKDGRRLPWGEYCLSCHLELY